MSIHPKARTVVSKLSFPSPIKKYFSKDEWVIDLSNNTNPYLKEFAEYPDVQQDALKKLYLTMVMFITSSGYLKNEHLTQLGPENILFTVGSMEGIDILLRTFCEPNKDTICVVHPAFSAYEHWASIHNLDVKRIPLSGENFNLFSVQEIIEAHPKMVFLCNPNNPIGTTLKSEQIETLCESIDGFVVVDEAYIEFSDQMSSLGYLHKYKNLIILRTFSKAWGLAGVRCGIILADKAVIHSLRYIQLPFSFSSPTQELVRNRLVSPETTFTSWKRIKADRQHMMQELSALESVERVFPSDTNFIMLVLKDHQRGMDLLKESKICVLDCSSSIPGSIRVSLGAENHNRKFIEALRAASY